MILTEQNQHTTNDLINRIAALEAERAIRNVLARYMELCDQPCHDQHFPQLDDLFTDNAIWEGVGELYTQTFGKQVGVKDIVTFLKQYLSPNPHFKKNTHFLTSDQIYVEGNKAHGKWIMMQISTYENDTAEAIGARLTIDFEQDVHGQWKMAHFRTQRLFNAPWDQDLTSLIKSTGENK